MSDSTPPAPAKKSLLRSRPVLWLMQLLLAFVFIFASWDKFLHPRAFRSIIERYEVPYLEGLPLALATLLTPSLELILGVLLATGILLQGALIWTILLYIGFLILLAQALFRGLEVSNCGCFSVTAENVEGWNRIIYSVEAHLVMDIGLLFLACWVYWNRFGCPARRRREAEAG